MKTDSVICAKFQVIFHEFANFQKLRQIKRSGKMLEPQVISTNLSAVHHHWPKLSFSTKRHWFGDVRKVSNDFDAI